MPESSFETLRIICVLGVFLFTIIRPVFCHGFFGCLASATVSVCRPIFWAAFWSSSCLGAGTATFLGVFLPCVRVFVESKYAGHKKILFCFRMLAQLFRIRFLFGLVLRLRVRFVLVWILLWLFLSGFRLWFLL